MSLGDVFYMFLFFLRKVRASDLSFLSSLGDDCHLRDPSGAVARWIENPLKMDPSTPPGWWQLTYV